VKKKKDQIKSNQGCSLETDF